MSVTLLLILSAALPWKPTSTDTLESRIAPPPGFHRGSTAPKGFARFLRNLPVLPGRPPVKLYNGKPKANQEAHELVFDVDVGKKNLQQCADAVMRLRAEYLRSIGQGKLVRFKFTSGHESSWRYWQEGYRPKIRGNKVSFNKTAAPNSSYKNFRKYLDSIFMYAGTYSLRKELTKKVGSVQAGDVFIQGGFPGHAVIIVDVVINETGEQRFLLAQSYMPAQQIHLLRNPKSDSPWYAVPKNGVLRTPEWDFQVSDLRSF